MQPGGERGGTGPHDPLVDVIGQGLIGRYYGVVDDHLVGDTLDPTSVIDLTDEAVVDLTDRRVSRRSTREARARWQAFRGYWVGHLLSTIGDHLTVVALPLAANRTNAATVGLVVGAQTAATVVLGTFAGTFTDRRDARRTLIVSDLLRAALLMVVAVAAWRGDIAPWALIVTAFTLGLLNLTHDGAQGALVARLVPDELDVRSNNRLVLSESIGSTIGPVLGGIAAQFALWVAFGLDGITFVMASASVAYVARVAKLRRIDLSSVHADVAVHRPSFLRESRAAFPLVFSNPVFARTLVVVAMFNLCALPLTELFIPLAQNTLDMSPAVIGVMFAVGGIAGIAVAPLVERDPTIRAGVVPLSTGIMGAAVLGVGIWPTTATVAVAFATGGVAFAFAMTHFSALRQRLFEVHQQGRVMLTSRTIIWSTVLGGALAGGYLSDWLSPEALWLVCGGVGIATALWGFATGLGSAAYRTSDSAVGT